MGTRERAIGDVMASWAQALPASFHRPLKLLDFRRDRYVGPMTYEMRRLMGAARHSGILPDNLLDGLAACFDFADFKTEFAPWLEHWPVDGSLQRRLCRGRRWGGTRKLKMGLHLFYLRAGTSEPPHYHHLSASLQWVLAGRVRYRTYDRVARLAPDRVIIRPAEASVNGPGECLRMTEHADNVHWFGADDEPTVILVFFIEGTTLYEDPFEADFARNLGRHYIDPTGEPDSEGLISARELSEEEAYARFAGRVI